MHSTPIRRVVLVVLDGLRPDAIPRYDLPVLSRLVAEGASTLLGRTVEPSVTACAMASLLTGAAPERHGLQSDRFHVPRGCGRIDPLPRVLAAHALHTSAFLKAMPFGFTRIARRIAHHLGVSAATFAGRNAHEIVGNAGAALRDQRQGLILVHLPDGDRAGHEAGWMSGPYEAAVRGMDLALGRIVQSEGLDDPRTLFIALADHGGGGAASHGHDSAHPLDRTIPIILAGGAVRPGALGPASLLDVPATICHALGVPQPESFAGRPLRAALDLSRPVSARRPQFHPPYGGVTTPWPNGVGAETMPREVPA